MKQLLYLSVLAFLLSIQSCKSDENEVNVNNVEVITVRSSSVVDDSKVVFLSDDIKSFNIKTGELEMNGNIQLEKIIANSKLVFYMDDKPLFNTSTFVTDVMSQIFNDMVLYLDSGNGRLYIRDGYPSVDVLGTSKEKCKEAREENMKQRSSEWNLFLQVLEKANKLKNE